MNDIHNFSMKYQNERDMSLKSSLSNGLGVEAREERG